MGTSKGIKGLYMYFTDRLGSVTKEVSDPFSMIRPFQFLFGHRVRGRGLSLVLPITFCYGVVPSLSGLTMVGASEVFSTFTIRDSMGSIEYGQARMFQVYLVPLLSLDGV